MLKGKLQMKDRTKEEIKEKKETKEIKIVTNQIMRHKMMKPTIIKMRRLMAMQQLNPIQQTNPIKRTHKARLIKKTTKKNQIMQLMMLQKVSTKELNLLQQQLEM